MRSSWTFSNETFYYDGGLIGVPVERSGRDPRTPRASDDGSDGRWVSSSVAVTSRTYRSPSLPVQLFPKSASAEEIRGCANPVSRDMDVAQLGAAEPSLARTDCDDAARLRGKSAINEGACA